MEAGDLELEVKVGCATQLLVALSVAFSVPIPDRRRRHPRASFSCCKKNKGKQIMLDKISHLLSQNPIH